MTDTNAPKTTSAQRQAALRQRARALAYGLDDAQIRSAPDTAILEAVAIAFRNRQSAALEDLAVELLRRLDRHVAVTKIDPPPIPAPAVTVTQALPETPVTERKPSAREYPADVRRMALKMRDEGAKTGDTDEAVKAAVGRSPGCSNLAKLLRQWREATQTCG
jgi:hypothetical protein